MEICTLRAKKIDALVRDPESKKGEYPIKVSLSGRTEQLKVYRLPIKSLIFNIRNGRFASELIEKEKELKRKLNPTTPADAKIIQKLLLEQDEHETEALKEDLKKHGQMNPGIITWDGAVINGNRRMAILSELQKETGDVRYEFLRVARLPETVRPKDLWRLEAGLQFAKEFRLEYGPVNELLKLREGLEQGLTIKEISRALLGRYSEKKVNEKLDILRLMETYLKQIKRPGQYFYIQDMRLVEKFNSLFASVIAPLRKDGLKNSEIAKVTMAGFSMIDKTDLSHWDVRQLREIAKNDRAKSELLKPLSGNAHAKASSEVIKEAFESANDIVKGKKERDRPERLVKKALSALQSIDPESGKLGTKKIIQMLEVIKDEVAKLLRVRRK